MAVTSAPQAMQPQHLCDPKQRVHMSRWHYKRRECPWGQFSNYPFKLHIYSVCEFFCVNTLSISSPLAAALHVVDSVLKIILCTVGTWEPLDYLFILPKTLAMGKQGITKKQQEQAGAECYTEYKKEHQGPHQL